MVDYKQKFYKGCICVDAFAHTIARHLNGENKTINDAYVMAAIIKVFLADYQKLVQSVSEETENKNDGKSLESK